MSWSEIPWPVSDTETTKGIDPFDIQFLRNPAVTVGKEVVPLIRSALMITNEKDDIPAFRLVEKQLVPGQTGKAVLIDDHLGGKVNGMDLPDFLGSEHMDHVLGHQFSHLADAGEPFDEDRIDRPLILEKVRVRDRDIFNHGVVPVCGICHTYLQGSTVQDVLLRSAVRRQDR